MDNLGQLLPWFVLVFSRVILELLPIADEIDGPLLIVIILLKEASERRFAARWSSPHMNNVLAVNELSENSYCFCAMTDEMKLMVCLS